MRLIKIKIPFMKMPTLNDFIDDCKIQKRSLEQGQFCQAVIPATALLSLL